MRNAVQFVPIVTTVVALAWEPSRGGDLFPHLYGDLDLGAVTGVTALTARADGSHAIPELAP